MPGSIGDARHVTKTIKYIEVRFRMPILLLVLQTDGKFIAFLNNTITMIDKLYESAQDTSLLTNKNILL